MALAIANSPSTVCNSIPESVLTRRWQENPCAIPRATNQNLRGTHRQVSSRMKPRDNIASVSRSPLPLLQGERMKVRGSQIARRTKLQTLTLALSLGKGEADQSASPQVKTSKRRYTEMTTQVTPTLDEFMDLAKQGNVIPVFAEFIADGETPVSAFKKLDSRRLQFPF